MTIKTDVAAVGFNVFTVSLVNVLVSSSVPLSLLEQTDNRPALIIYPVRQTRGLFSAEVNLFTSLVIFLFSLIHTQITSPVERNSQLFHMNTKTKSIKYFTPGTVDLTQG